MDRTVNGITKADYQSWRHHPVTKAIFRFLSDKREFMQQTAVERWLAGTLDLMTDNTIRGQCIELSETVNIPFEAMLVFYEKEETDAAPIT